MENFRKFARDTKAPTPVVALPAVLGLNAIVAELICTDGMLDLRTWPAASDSYAHTTSDPKEARVTVRIEDLVAKLADLENQIARKRCVS